MRRALAWCVDFFLSLHIVFRVLLVVAVIAPIAYGVYYARWNHVNCAEGIAKVNGGCVGITDGSHGPVFGDGSAEALRLIGEENARIAADSSGKGVVSIAYLVPIPPPGVDDDYAVRISGDVMGAAVAQRQANRTNTLGDRPLIRLLVANVGSSANAALEPVEKLVEMTRSGFVEHRLMAVVVSGKSLDPMTNVIDTLIKAEVPVIASHLTAEQVTSVPAAADMSLARVSPTTSDESAALAAYLRSSSTRAMIVQNSDSDDHYAASLGARFREHYADATHTFEPDETYIGGETAANAMRRILVNICQKRPDVVFFAGRAPELAAFVAALPRRTCLDHQIRVVTGDDGAAFTAAVARGEPGLREGLEANASLAYTALAHPEAWRASPGGFAPGSAEFLTGSCAECFPTLFPGHSLDDSYAIMAYDAVMTAVTAIRQPGLSVSSPEAVIQEFKGLHGPEAVAGASGWISLAPEGNAIDKAVAVMGVPSDGNARFIQLSSPSGAPCTPGTPPC